MREGKKERQRERAREREGEREETMQQIFSQCAHADELDAYAVSCTDPDINFTEKCEHALMLRKRIDSTDQLFLFAHSLVHYTGRVS